MGNEHSTTGKIIEGGFAVDNNQNRGQNYQNQPQGQSYYPQVDHRQSQ